MVYLPPSPGRPVMGTIAGNGETDRVSATLDPAVLAELIRLAISLRHQTPTEVAPADALQSRRDFLRESLGETREADTVFERIIRGDELQPINYLERGAIAARAVARVALAPGGGFGTGFLIAPQVLITNNHDEIVYSKCYGLADLGTQRPITTDTSFYLASISKQFTAMAIMMLAERGKLSFDDHLPTYFPRFPAWAEGITLRHMLHHTSGLPDYLPFFKGDEFVARDMANLVYGTNSSETINALDGVTFGDDIIYGYGGNDSIRGLGGDDYIVGGTGAEALNGGIGSHGELFHLRRWHRCEPHRRRGGRRRRGRRYLRQHREPRGQRVRGCPCWRRREQLTVRTVRRRLPRRRGRRRRIVGRLGQ